MRSRLVAVLLSKSFGESRTSGASDGARPTSPHEKSSSLSRRLLSKPKPGTDWIGSKCAGPHCSSACFEPEFDCGRGLPNGDYGCCEQQQNRSHRSWPNDIIPHDPKSRSNKANESWRGGVAPCDKTARCELYRSMYALQRPNWRVLAW